MRPLERQPGPALSTSRTDSVPHALQTFLRAEMDSSQAASGEATGGGSSRRCGHSYEIELPEGGYAELLCVVSGELEHADLKLTLPRLAQPIVTNADQPGGAVYIDTFRRLVAVLAKQK